MRLLPLLAVALAVLASAPIAAQPDPDPDPYGHLRVEPGTRVRIRDFNAGRRYTGTLLSVDPDSVVLRRRGARFAYPLAGVSRIEVSEGRDRVRGGAIGAAIGLAAGAVVGIAAGPDCGDECGTTVVDDDDSPTLDDVALFAGAGAALGGLGGWIFGPERWAPARLRRVRPEAEATPEGGMALGVRVTF